MVDASYDSLVAHNIKGVTQTEIRWMGLVPIYQPRRIVEQISEIVITLADMPDIESLIIGGGEKSQIKRAG